jgi:hypothetical protein
VLCPGVMEVCLVHMERGCRGAAGCVAAAVRDVVDDGASTSLSPPVVLCSALRAAAAAVTLADTSALVLLSSVATGAPSLASSLFSLQLLSVHVEDTNSS